MQYKYCSEYLLLNKYEVNERIKMKKFISFVFLFPIILLIFIFSLGFIDHALGLGICHGLLHDIYYSSKFHHQSNPRKSCLSNQRVLMGAMDMYNMDHSEMMTTLDEEELLRGGYIKSKINKPSEKCIYRCDGDFTETGKIYCEYHGEVDGEQPEAKYKPSPEYYKELQRKSYNRTLNILTQYGAVFIIVGIITWSILK